MDLSEAIALYIQAFDEGPPIFEMVEEDAIAAMVKAIETGEAIKQGAEMNIPKDAYL
ncbi:MAG: hypothetical protein OEY89_08060 [Gammaproteobacteria bacterium]|nr:hypothetical protein [Gammaproteobacteria bacterium]